MDRRALSELAERKWDRVAANRRQYRRERFARLGTSSAVAASQALWQHMRAVRPDWPNERQRAGDLEAHIALKRSIDRAAHAFTPRRPPV